MKNNKLILLDGDLTLFHNPKLHSTINELIKELNGEPYIKEIINTLLIKRYHWSFKEMAKDIAKIIWVKLEDIINEKQLKDFEKAHLNEVNWFEFYPDSLDFLKELKKLDIRSCLASNATEFYRLISRKVLKLDKILDALYLSCELWKWKLDKTFYELILQVEKQKPENTIMIWDNINADIIPAKEAWLDAIQLDRQSESVKNDTFSQHLNTKNNDTIHDYLKTKNLDEVIKIIKERI